MPLTPADSIGGLAHPAEAFFRTSKPKTTGALSERDRAQSRLELRALKNQKRRLCGQKALSLEPSAFAGLTRTKKIKVSILAPDLALLTRSIFVELPHRLQNELL